MVRTTVADDGAKGTANDGAKPATGQAADSVAGQAADGYVHYQQMLDSFDEEMDSYAAFRKVGKAKQKQILDAAMQEFADFGYSGASTNRIVSQAGISKGLLFHYFGDKQGLCIYLWAYCTNLLVRDTLSYLDLNSGDVFDVVRVSIAKKLTVAMNHPLESRFCVRLAVGDTPDVVKMRVNAVFAHSYDTMAAIADQLDPKLLKDGLDRQLSAKIIEWAVEGLSRHIVATVKPDEALERYNEISDSCQKYMTFLRDLLYKPVDPPPVATPKPGTALASEATPGFEAVSKTVKTPKPGTESPRRTSSTSPATKAVAKDNISIDSNKASNN